jgi:hypothetical protein
MTTKPTYDHFKKWLAFHLSKAVETTARETHSVTAMLNANGAYRSGRAILLIFEEINKGLEIGINAALGETKRIARLTDLDAAELRVVTEESLRAFLDQLKNLAKADQMRTWGSPRLVDERLAKLDERLNFALQNFDIGFLDPGEPELPPTMSNNINIGNMSGGAIQQGATHSTLNQSNFNLSEAQQVLEAFRLAFETENLTTDQRGNIDADVATLKAQLSKPTRSEAIIKETMHSLRNVVEGITAGALTPAATTAATALWTFFR